MQLEAINSVVERVRAWNFGGVLRARLIDASGDRGRAELFRSESASHPDIPAGVTLLPLRTVRTWSDTGQESAASLEKTIHSIASRSPGNGASRIRVE
jgi:hypothetical protein